MKDDLACGVWLEGRGARLLWGSTLGELLTIVPPDYWNRPRYSPPATKVAWNDQVWGGLSCQLVTTFGGSDWPQSELNGIEIFFRAPNDLRHLRDAFRWLQERLTQRLGASMTLRDDGEQGEASWELDGVAIRHEFFDGFGGGHSVYVFRRDNHAEPPAAPDRDGE